MIFVIQFSSFHEVVEQETVYGRLFDLQSCSDKDVQHCFSMTKWVK